MHPLYLIVGQGIAGALVSYELWTKNRSFLVFDEPQRVPRASIVAGAVINPVNVHKWTYAEDQQHFIAAALHTYRNMEQLLGIPLLEKTSLLVFQQSEKERQLFESRRSSFPGIIQQPDLREIAWIESFFHNRFGMGRIVPVWKLKANDLLCAWHQFLRERGMLRQEFFEVTGCRPDVHGVQYKDLRAEKIIFCEGAAAMQNPYFRHLPFTRNRGDALLVSIPGLPATHIYQYGIRLVPVAKEIFWCGSNYRWQYNDLLPDRDWRRETEDTLRHWLKLSFKVEDHIVAERPTTAGQQFLTGELSSVPSVVIFNGLGTKGFSCGPALAKDLCLNLSAPDHTASLPGFS